MALLTALRRFCRADMLVWWTLLGVILGTAVGAGLYNSKCSDLTIEIIGYPGELYIRALQQLVLPLIVFALMTGVFSLRQAEGGVGKITRWSLFYYLVSMILAAILGISLVYFIKPGKSQPFRASSSMNNCSENKNLSVSAGDDTSITESFLDIGRNLIPENIVAAAAEPNYLGVVASAITFAFCINSFGERADPLVHLIELCNDVIIKIIFGVITFTPLGVASLTANTLLKACDVFHLIKSLGLYVGTVLTGLFLHSFVVLPITVLVLSQRNPFKLLKKFLPALFMGLGTSSGAVTMPVTMECAEASGCEPSLVRFVIPLGTNINRDGSALYEAVSVLFICQAHGLDLPLSKLFVLTIAATLAAIGAASVPNSGLVTMITALHAVGLSQYVADVSILYTVDWLLGAVRTSVNIWGDGCACLIIDEWTKRSGQQKYPLPVSVEVTEPLLPAARSD